MLGFCAPTSPTGRRPAGPIRSAAAGGAGGAPGPGTGGAATERIVTGLTRGELSLFPRLELPRLLRTHPDLDWELMRVFAASPAARRRSTDARPISPRPPGDAATGRAASRRNPSPDRLARTPCVRGGPPARPARRGTQGALLARRAQAAVAESSPMWVVSTDDAMARSTCALRRVAGDERRLVGSGSAPSAGFHPPTRRPSSPGSTGEGCAFGGTRRCGRARSAPALVGTLRSRGSA
jgi:hypothetical protein